MITQKWIERALNAEELVFETTGTRCYVLFAEQLGLSIHDGCGGFCCGFLSSTVKRLLPDRFSGDMATIVLNQDCFNQFFFDKDDRRYFNSILCHEAGHVVDLWSAGVPSFEPKSPVEYVESIQSQVQLEPQQWAGHVSPVVRWLGHEDRYIRATCHIAHRMNERCSPVDNGIVWPADYYELSSFDEYSEALADELIEREGDDIGTILKSEPPPEFAELWLRDSLPGRALMLSAGSVE